MPKLGRLFLFCILTFLVSLDGYAQLSTLGKEFVLGFMENNNRPNQPDLASVIITANEDSEGMIQAGGKDIPFSLQKGEQFYYEFNNGEDLIHRSSGTVETKAAFISSSGEIAVHAVNQRQRSLDGTVVLPITALGKEYYVTAHADVFGAGQDPGANLNYESTLLILAVENNTEIEIVTSTNTVNTIPANAPLTIFLNAGESYQIKAKGDLTGSRIRVMNSTDGDCKNIAVFGGNKLTSAGDCGTTGDHLFQQAYPVKNWGKSYIHVPLAGRTSGEIVKVLASEDNTEVTVNGGSVGNLDAGEFLKLEFGPKEVVSIESSNPTAVSVLAKSQACNDFNDTFSAQGDPSLITYSDNSQRIKSILFSTPVGDEILKHYANVMVPSEAAGQTVLNGQNVGAEFLPVPGNPGFSYAQLVINEGGNSLSNPEGLIAYAYGDGFISSYGYATGASLENVQFEAESTYDFEVEGDQVACFGKEGVWEIIPDNPMFQSFLWDFGDGTELKSGKEVTHTFEEEGVFEVVVLASTGEGNCDSEEEFKFEVEVKKIEGELIGPSAICLNADEVTYTFENTDNFERVVWEVVDGIELVSTDSTLTVKWDVETQNGSVKAIPYSENGCQGEIQEIQVQVSNDAEPDRPLGPEGICGVLSETVTYTIPFPSDQNTYQWVVTGGTIIDGQGTIEVEVQWEENAPERSLYYESTSLVNSLCAGISQVLDVFIYPEFEVSISEKLSPACPGESNGSIVLDPQGGSGNYQVEWSHDPLLESFSAFNLSQGTYEVKIKDLSGCGEEVLMIELEDLEPLSLLDEPLTNEVSCHDAADGSYQLRVSGGTPPYEVEGQQSEWDGAFLKVTGLPKGPFSHTILDSRSCSIPVEGIIEGPDPLTLTFNEISPSCPGGGDGVLEVIPAGGVAPYEIIWDNGLNGAIIDGLSSGEFSVTVTDANGCVVTGSGVIQPSKPQVRMPSGFLPSEGVYEPISNCPITYLLLIWDRWGQLIYSGNEGWNGELKGTSVDSGVFTYKITYEFSLENGVGSDSETGTFTLIR
ncbi:PKD domain-containing protein [Algoriphagus halophilus]|uniref:SprB repeat-containing protein n=1 Tax=Algoriphagus halophilus TaxID=226505 RepID=A0A1N6E7T7_9BACT|nr:PKD domain-containing protein [Algoriphagus halophilus]SIN79063.1 SprB repeat-containing protein [Algoriphagus halophilus]